MSNLAHAGHQPNILLLVAEDLSPRVGAYGDTIAQTPNIDALARSSVKYTSAFTTAGVCAPSRAALIMGMHQISFGAQHMRTSTGPLGPYLAKPPGDAKAFPEILRMHGYYTYTDRKLDYQFSGIRAGTGPFTIWDADGAADTGWRNRQTAQPFFGLINFIETHESGVMRAHGEPYSETHAGTQQFRKALGVVAEPSTNPELVEIPPYYPDLPQVRQDLASHYDNIAAMDQRVGQILTALIEDGLFDDTIIIWTSDHGDGLPRAKRELFDSGIKVPMLMSIPPQLREPFIAPPAQMPQTDDRLVSFVDLAPTILAFANIEAPGFLHGRSVFHEPREFVYASRDRIDEVVDRQRAIRSQGFKYIRSWHPDVPGGHSLAYRDNLDMVRAMREAFTQGTLNAHQARWFEAVGEEQLYNLQNDPHELHNLADAEAYASQKRRMAQALEKFLKTIGDTSTESESLMRESLLEAGQIPRTPTPKLTRQGDFLVVHTPPGSSSAFQMHNSTTWQLYKDPIPLNVGEHATESARIKVKAVRYGWQESAVAEYAWSEHSD